MTTPPSEKSIEARFVRECTKRGWLSLKQNVIGRRGFPDRLVVRQDGLHVWIELKRPGGRLSEGQKVAIDQLTNHGALVFVCFSADEAIDIIERVEELLC